MYQQLVDWFREKHKMEVAVYYESDIGWWATVNSIKNEKPLCSNEYYNTYYEALNKALEEAFKIINKLLNNETKRF